MSRERKSRCTVPLHFPLTAHRWPNRCDSRLGPHQRTTDLQLQARRLTATRTEGSEQSMNLIEVMIAHPVENEAIGSKQSEATFIQLGLQGSQPGIEVLRRNLFLQGSETLLPK